MSTLLPTKEMVNVGGGDGDGGDGEFQRTRTKLRNFHPYHNNAGKLFQIHK